LTIEQTGLANEALDRLKDAGTVIVDQRDIDVARYQKARPRTPCAEYS
jgi:hypothetical protein